MGREKERTDMACLACLGKIMSLFAVPPGPFSTKPLLSQSKIYEYIGGMAGPFQHNLSWARAKCDRKYQGRMSVLYFFSGHGVNEYVAFRSDLFSSYQISWVLDMEELHPLSHLISCSVIGMALYTCTWHVIPMEGLHMYWCENTK